MPSPNFLFHPFRNTTRGPRPLSVEKKIARWIGDETKEISNARVKLYFEQINVSADLVKVIESTYPQILHII
jgi:hypothetical protein